MTTNHAEYQQIIITLTKDLLAQTTRNETVRRELKKALDECSTLEDLRMSVWITSTHADGSWTPEGDRMIRKAFADGDLT